MIKRLLFVAAIIAVVSTLSFAQNWVKVPFGNPAIDTLRGTSGAHGVTIDPDGKIWVAVYQPLVADSVQDATTGTWTKVRPIWIFNADGSPASFSPIKVWKNGSTVVPLGGGSNTGINVNDKGNILLCNGQALYMFDYKTGAGLYKYTDFPSGAGNINRPAVDNAGNVFISYVFPKYPVRMLNPDLTYNSNAVDTIASYGRSLEVSPDGNTLYAGRYGTKSCYIYSRASEFDAFAPVDTLKGWTFESQGFNKKTGILYMAAGSPFDKPQTDPVANPGLFYPKATLYTTYGIDVAKRAVVDSLTWVATSKSLDERARGIVFSKDGSFAITCEFNETTIPCVQKFQHKTGVETEKPQTVSSYALSQNFPNPFNPTTQIEFSVAKAGQVSLKVYDMLGKEVATLVNEQMSAGTHTAQFNAQNLTSGIYVYQLRVNGVVLSQKMTLMK